MGEGIDYEARRMATEALVRIEAHEKSCNDRMIEIREFHKDIRSDQKATKTLIIVTLLAVVGFLFSRLMGWA